MTDRSREDDDAGIPRRRYLRWAGLAGIAATAGCRGRDRATETRAMSDTPFDTTTATPTDEPPPTPETPVDEGRPPDSGGSRAAGDVVVAGPGMDGPTLIDPTSTDTPIGDGMDLLRASGGVIRLPPGTVTEADPIRPRSDTAIVGLGPGLSGIEITAGNDGILFDRTRALDRVYLDRFVLQGPGLDRQSGVAIKHASGDTQNLWIGHVAISGWTDSVYRVEEGVGPFECRHDLLAVYDCDAGDADGLFEFRSSFGPANWFGTIAVYPRSSASGQDSTAIFTRGGTQVVESLVVGGAAGTALFQTRVAQVDVGRIRWAPSSQVATPSAIVRLAGGGPARIGEIEHAAGTVDYAYRLTEDTYTGTGPDRKVIGPYDANGGGGRNTRLRESVVDLAAGADPGAPSLYFGAASGVERNYDGEPTGGFRVLGDAGTGV